MKPPVIKRHFNAQTPFSEAKDEAELKKILILKYPKACSSLEVDARYFAKMVQDIEKYEAYKTLGFDSLEDFCVAKLQMTLDETMSIVGAVKQMIKEGAKDYSREAVEEHGKKLAVDVIAGKIPKLRADGNRYDNIIPAKQQGTSTEYTLRRLARDGHTEVLDRIAAGEVSVNKAAIEVGYRKKPTPLDRLRTAWEKASREERKEFLAEIS